MKTEAQFLLSRKKEVAVKIMRERLREGGIEKDYPELDDENLYALLEIYGGRT